MRQLYIDEAGISDHEPVTVVAGIVVNPDTQLAEAEKLLALLISTVPASIRENGFISHAKHVWNKREWWDIWPEAERLKFLQGMLQIPILLNIPISIGMIRKEYGPPPGAKFTLKEFHHIVTFHGCVAQADRYMCKCTHPLETLMVIAETNNIETKLKSLFKKMRRGSVQLPELKRRVAYDGKQQGPAVHDVEFKITRVKEAVLFADKDDSTLLQIADALAFCFRRYFAKLPDGEAMVAPITANANFLEDFKDDSFGTFLLRRAMPGEVQS